MTIRIRHWVSRFALLIMFSFNTYSVAAIEIGKAAPSFSLEGMNSQTHNLGDFSNKIVFVNFWASWCPPCRTELPMLDSLQQRHSDVVVIAINIDSDRESAIEFVEGVGIKSLVLFDTNTTVVSEWKAIAMPTSYILDQQGIVRYSHYGFKPNSDPSKWEEEIALLRDKKK